MGEVVRMEANKIRCWSGDGYAGNQAYPSTFTAGRTRRDTKAGHVLQMLGAALVETVWTTRCIICDRPGSVLCETCRLRLPYLDRWLACPRCGSPHGRGVCVSCNTFSLAEVGRINVPFDRCISAIEHRGMARSIVTGYKDAGERRLARVMARIIADAMPDSWTSRSTAITYVPADRKALRRRGFDHMAPIARELAQIASMPCIPLLEKLPASDQRGLTRRERFANTAGTIRANRKAVASAPGTAIIVDDVYTTGATLFAASDALRSAGVRCVYCATFARVP